MISIAHLNNSFTAFENLSGEISTYLTLMESIAFSRTWKTVPASLESVLFKRIESIIKKPLELKNPLNQIKFTTNQTIKYNLEPLFNRLEELQWFARNISQNYRQGLLSSNIIIQKNDDFLSILCSQAKNKHPSESPHVVYNIDMIRPFIELKREFISKYAITNALTTICRIYDIEQDPYLATTESEIDRASSSSQQPPKNFSSKRLELVNFLIEECHVNSNSYNHLGHTPLLQAISSKDINLIEFLLEKKANPNQKGTCMEITRENEPPFSCSSIPLFRSGVFSSVNPSSKSLEAFRLLLSHGADINIADDRGTTCLMLAVYGNLPLVQEILNHPKINPHQQDVNEKTARSLVKCSIDFLVNIPENNFFGNNNNTDPSLGTYQQVLFLLNDAMASSGRITPPIETHADLMQDLLSSSFV